MTLKYLSEFILLLWVIFGIGKKITIHWIVLLPLLKEKPYECAFKQYSNAHTGHYL